MGDERAIALREIHSAICHDRPWDLWASLHAYSDLVGFNAVLGHGLSALGYCVATLAGDCLRLVLDMPQVDVDVCGGSGTLGDRCPLMLCMAVPATTAAEVANCRRIMAILANHPRIDVNRLAVSSGGFYPIKIALMLDYPDHFDLLLRAPNIFINKARLGRPRTAEELQAEGKTCATLQDAIHFGTPTQVLMTLVAGADPNALNWVPDLGVTSMYEFNMRQCIHAMCVKDLEHVKAVARLLLDSGHRSRVDPDLAKKIHHGSEIVPLALRSRFKDTVAELTALPLKGVQPLGNLARFAVYQQLRRVVGRGTVHRKLRELLQSELLPVPVRTNLTYGGVLDD